MKNLNIKNELNIDLTKSSSIVQLNPNWVTGFMDGEGSVIIAILPSTGPLNNKISLRISITQKAHSKIVLFYLQKFFDCGQVIPSSKDCMRFVVQSKEDIIKKIIPHFDNYPLKTSKQLNFESFKEAFNYLNLKEIKLNPHWIQAFVDAEGTFGTLISKSEATNKIITRNRLSISQSSHDYSILKAIKEFFNAGSLNPRQENINSLEKARSCNDSSFYYNSSPETFIDFFYAYPMFTRKSLDYLDFKNFYLLKKNKHYLTKEGFKEMTFIAMNMNSGRDNLNHSRRKSK